MERHSTSLRGPLVLIVLDGFGLAAPGDGNAVTLARTPVLDRLYQEGLVSKLEASGLDVGLPDGVMGNSEVGHLNLGAGRVVPQDIVRIDEAISAGAFHDNETLGKAVAHAAATGGCLHLMGLYSDGCVHAADRHVWALVDLAARVLPPERVLLHLFTDGRDTPPRSADGYVRDLEDRLAGKARIATVTGRYHAMDRDQRWDRVERAFRAVALGEGRHAESAAAAVDESYERGKGDEFIDPTCIDGSRGIRSGDAAIFWNYRADRARQLCRALTDPEFSEFDRGADFPHDLVLVSMTEYTADQPFDAAFPPLGFDNVAGQVWADLGLRQLRIAETEKYAHVTYFFNGGREEPFEGEERVMVPSPRVDTYDLEPAMRAEVVTDRLLARLDQGGLDVVVLNFANTDMVGHTGVIPAAVEAVETVDACIGRILERVVPAGGAVLITADHGNAEQMIDPETGEPHTAHTTLPVPCLLVGAPSGFTLRDGCLADVAPTLLQLQGIDPPVEMTGTSLLAAR